MGKAKTATEILFEVPVAQVDLGGYATEHVNVQLACGKRAYALKMLQDQLMRSGAKVRSRGGEEMPVTTPGRVVLWMLDRVVDGAEDGGIALTK